MHCREGLKSHLKDCLNPRSWRLGYIATSFHKVGLDASRQALPEVDFCEKPSASYLVLVLVVDEVLRLSQDL